MILFSSRACRRSFSPLPTRPASLAHCCLLPALSGAASLQAPVVAREGMATKARRVSSSSAAKPMESDGALPTALLATFATWEEERLGK